MKKFLNEFKDFALKGNVMSLAVGVIIGAAFQGVVTSLTDNILSPIIGLFTGQNFDTLKLEVIGITLKYGAFITTVINFFIMAFVIFLIMRGMNKIMSIGKHEPEPEPEIEKKGCPYCFAEVDKRAVRCPHCTSGLADNNF
ncbi:MAG: large conductance mechanosensitive channel protein MscL [Oscillospiraceae bacterium]|nr:large conductance mechanosensitive channel protein MscL [Oscillospiraceae bacterium]